MKKIIIISASTVFICIIAVLFFVVLERQQTINPQNGNQNSFAGTGKQQVDKYLITVPQGMIGTKAKNTAGGSTLTIKNSSSDSPIIQIQETNANLSSYQRQQGVFAALRYSGTPVTVGGVFGTKYIGSLPEPSGTNIYETVTLVQKDDIVYQISLSYTGNSRNSQYEDMYGNFLNNFSFN